MNRAFNNRVRKPHCGFTLMEIVLVIAIIIVLAALLIPALSSAKSRARRVECQTRFRQWAVGFLQYPDDHDGNVPREGYDDTGNVQWNNWNAVRSARSQDVWYNALSNYVGVPSASSYSSFDSRPRFYDSSSLFQCPSAVIPDTSLPIAFFSMAMNSQFIDPPDNFPTTRIERITSPSHTVLFFDNLMERERRVAQQQAWDNLGQPAAMASRFAGARHGKGGNIAFADGSVRWCVGEKVVETTGPGAGFQKLPEADIIWNLE
jgi:prepilin-type processing-associated H-X9-DG protein